MRVLPQFLVSCCAILGCDPVPPDVIEAEDSCGRYADEGCLDDQGYATASECVDLKQQLSDEAAETGCEVEYQAYQLCAWYLDSDCMIDCDGEWETYENCRAAAL